MMITGPWFDYEQDLLDDQEAFWDNQDYDYDYDRNREDED